MNSKSKSSYFCRNKRQFLFIMNEFVRWQVGRKKLEREAGVNFFNSNKTAKEYNAICEKYFYGLRKCITCSKWFSKPKLIFDKCCTCRSICYIYKTERKSKIVTRLHKLGIFYANQSCVKTCSVRKLDSIGYVYFFKVGKYLKVGRTVDLGKRIKQGYSSYKVKQSDFLGAILTSNCYLMESHFHSMLSKIRVDKRELFYCKDFDSLISSLNKHISEIKTFAQSDVLFINSFNDCNKENIDYMKMKIKFWS